MKKNDNDMNIKTESKFKVGDWVIDKQGIVHQIANVVENVTNHTYGYDTVDGDYFNDSTEDVRHWDIRVDAKDGDILTNDNDIILFKGYKPFYRTDFHCMYNEELDIFCTWALVVNLRKTTNYHPATKEQRKLLFQKISENGYFWDSKNMRLIKKIIKT